MNANGDGSGGSDAVAVVVHGNDNDDDGGNITTTSNKKPRLLEHDNDNDEKDWRVWLISNESKLPNVFQQHLRWVVDHGGGNDFEACFVETPPTMKEMMTKLQKARQAKMMKQKKKMAEQSSSSNTSTAIGSATTEASVEGSSATTAMDKMIQMKRKPTMIPVKNPLKVDKLTSLLKSSNEMSKDEVTMLCEAVQGYHPGALKGPLENWLFDSFLCSAEEIIPNLWLGGYFVAHNQERLVKDMKIQRVVCVGGNSLKFDDDTDSDKYHPPFANQGIQYHVVDVDDTEKSSDVDTLGSSFESCYDFIENGLKSDQRTYVHCMAGTSRSATIVCAYLIKKFHTNNNNGSNGRNAMTTMDVNQALELVRSARPVATPNPSFIVQLENWYQKVNDNDNK